jgi:hypothetical protein
MNRFGLCGWDNPSIGYRFFNSPHLDKVSFTKLSMESSSTIRESMGIFSKMSVFTADFSRSSV